MKIGIVTFHNADNYGAVLQAYALQSHLMKTGHEPFFINYKYYFEGNQSGLFSWMGRSPRNTYRLIKRRIIGQSFTCFRNKFLNIGMTTYTDYRKIQNLPPDADAYICGSDQIWSPAHTENESDGQVSWLSFGNKSIRRVSYAASFGVNSLDVDTCLKWASLADQFYAISVREENGINLMEKLGRTDAVWVPDPTLLLNASEYVAVENPKINTEVPYLFAFILAEPVVLEIASVVSVTLKIPNREASPYSFQWYFRGGYKGPGRWLSELHCSKFVVTDSFHALSFCLIFHRPFIVVLRGGIEAKRNCRIISLLSIVGLESRAMSECDIENIKLICHQDVDWDMVDKKLNAHRSVGTQFLSKALA